MRPGVAGSAVVSELCRRLDRLPLALELAAARTKLLAPEALLERLEDRLDLLRGARDAEERHATLRATIAWSYDLLEEDERRLLARLAVFRGGCTLDSAENVCDAQLDTLASLLDKSLVRRRTERVGDERFWLLETIREFASERLEESDEANEIRLRHAKRMLAIARSAHLSEDDMESDVASGVAERDDFRAALDWAEENDPQLGLEIAVALQNVWNASGPEEGMRRLGRLLDLAEPVPPELRAKTLRVYGGTADLTGEYDRAERLWEESLRLYGSLGDERGIAAVEHMLAVAAWRREDWRRVRELTEHSRACSRQVHVRRDDGLLAPGPARTC